MCCSASSGPPAAIWPRIGGRAASPISTTSACSGASRRSRPISSKPRALELIGRERREAPEQAEVVEIGDAARPPILGQIAAGGPLLAEQHIEDYVAMPASAKGDFVLRVKGESMIDAGILDGDLVIVQRAQTARNGEIVVALAGDDESADEATVKTFYREDGRVRLQPENDALEPIYARHVQILGRVTGVFRSL